MKTALTIVLITLAFFPVKSQHTLSLQDGASSPKATIEDVAWIAGHWRGEAFGGITEEIWSPPIGNAMVASFRLVVDDKVSFYEIETITEENGSLILRLKHFHGNLVGWEEKDETVDFPLVKVERNKAYFDGMTFEKVSDTELNVYVVIEDQDGNKQEMKFPYKLVE